MLRQRQKEEGITDRPKEKLTDTVAIEQRYRKKTEEDTIDRRTERKKTSQTDGQIRKKGQHIYEDRLCTYFKAHALILISGAASGEGERNHM